MMRTIRSTVLLALAPLALWATTMVPTGSAAYGYSGGPPPTTTCPPDSHRNPAGHCPPGQNGGGGGGGGHGKNGAGTAAGAQVPADSGGGTGPRVATASAPGDASPRSGSVNQAGSIVREQPVKGSSVPVTRSDLVELVVLAVAVGGIGAMGLRRWLVSRRRLA